MAKLTKEVLQEHLQTERSTKLNEIGQSIVERVLQQAIESIQGESVDSITMNAEFEVKSSQTTSAEVCVKIGNVKVCYEFPK